MEKIINFENLRSFAYVNDRAISGPIRGIVLNFFGLNGNAMFDRDTAEGEYYGEKGLLYVIPYADPWAWMNRRTVALTDEIIDVLVRRYGLDGAPIASTGGSMGGLSALVYSVRAKRTPSVCAANCPVCDAVYHYGERPDLPRTLYCALGDEEGTLTDALASISPLHLIDRMPKIPYFIFHCDKDEAVDYFKHSVRFVNKMRERGYDVTFRTVPDRGHCDLPLADRREFADCILPALLKTE